MSQTSNARRMMKMTGIMVSMYHYNNRSVKQIQSYRLITAAMPQHGD
jgi:hypothetical protein